MSSPISASIDITYRCNLKCRHSYNSSGDFKAIFKRKELTDAEIINICREIAEISSIEQFCFCGGETLLRYKLIEKCTFEMKKINPNIMVNLVSNGILANEQILTKLKSCGIDNIQYSLDGISDDSYDFIRGSKGKLSNVKQAILKTCKLGIDVNVAVLPHQKNYREFEQIIDFCAEAGVVTFRTQPFMPIGRGAMYSDSIALTEEQYDELKKILSTKEKNLRNKGNYMQFEWGDPMDHFYVLQEVDDIPYITINAYGEIELSPYLPFVIWNLITDGSLVEYFDQNISTRILRLPLVKNVLEDMIQVEDLNGVIKKYHLPRIYEEEYINLKEQV